ncbi:hypothetical protein T492DRAFT_1150097 [Pavlovales sp. CCMP2436]|nr:hypothetical protein T492DRAFT_1150097 [Pavlovales sp. CCMP2436]
MAGCLLAALSLAITSAATAGAALPARLSSRTQLRAALDVRASPARLPSRTQLRAALDVRRALVSSLHAEGTDCYRILAAAEGAPGAGVVIDRYGGTIFVQTFRQPLLPLPEDFSSDEDAETTDSLCAELLGLADEAAAALGLAGAPRVLLSHRGRGLAQRARGPDQTYAALNCALADLQGQAPETCTEFGLPIEAALVPGRDPGIFLDFRAGRRWLRDEVARRYATSGAGPRLLHVCNVFSYTCTAGVATAAAAATVGGVGAFVLNVDHAQSSLEMGRRNAAAALAALSALSPLAAQASLVESSPTGAGEEAGFACLRADALAALRVFAGVQTADNRNRRAAAGNGRGGRGGGGGGRARSAQGLAVGGGGSGGGDAELEAFALKSGGAPRQFDILVLDGAATQAGCGARAPAMRWVQHGALLLDELLASPPTFAKGPHGAVDIVNDYQSLLKPALLALAPGGALLATNHAASVELAEWLLLLERCAAKAGRPLACSPEVIEPELDFPPTSPAALEGLSAGFEGDGDPGADGQHADGGARAGGSQLTSERPSHLLKMAVLRVPY